MLINNLKFAYEKKVIESEIDIDQLHRVNGVLPDIKGHIKYKIIGDVLDKPILCIEIYGKIITSCQNCLEEIEIDVKRLDNIFIFNNEKELDNALFSEDSSINEAILASDEFNVLEYIEDEIIMSVPIAPKHNKCINKIFSEVDVKDSVFSNLKNLINMKGSNNGSSTK